MSKNKNRDKGLRFERAVVTEATLRKLKAKRTWGSDGRSMGLSESVDVCIWHGIAEDRDTPTGKAYGARSDFQCKHYRKIPKYLDIPGDLSGIIMKQDNKDPVVTIRLVWLLDLLEERTYK